MFATRGLSHYFQAIVGFFLRLFIIPYSHFHQIPFPYSYFHEILFPYSQYQVMLCEWYGFDRTGIALRCRNRPAPLPAPSTPHPAPHLGYHSDDVIAKHSDDVTADDTKRTCCYHTRACLGPHTGRRPLVTAPNAYGLCAKCYRTRVDSR